MQFLSFDKCSLSHKIFFTSFDIESIFNTISEILFCEKWKNAINMKIQTLEKNQIWKIVDILKDKKLVGCTDICDKLFEDIRISSQDEHCANFIIISYSIWLVTTIIWCKKCIFEWRFRRKKFTWIFHQTLIEK